MANPTFGELIRAYREQGRGQKNGAAWTQEGLASKIGISDRQLRDWESSRVCPQQNNLQAAIDLFFKNPTTDEDCEKIRELRHAAKGLRSDISHRAYLQHAFIHAHRTKTLFSETFLSKDVTSLDFREEWQPMLLRLITETRSTLRAMVFDSELGRWWMEMPGIYYMVSNIKLVKNNVSVRRLFFVDGYNSRRFYAALSTAYVHQHFGIDVRVCNDRNIMESFPDNASMFSVHDHLFAGLYYFATEKFFVNIVNSGTDVKCLADLYDSIFEDDGVAVPCLDFLARYPLSARQLEAARMEISRFERLSAADSTLEMVTSIRRINDEVD